MRKRGLIALTVALVALNFAGCLESTPPEENDGSSPSPAEPDAGDDPLESGPDGIPKRVDASDCDGVMFGMQWPGRHPGTNRPPGWEREVNPFTSVSASLWRCDRLSWGPFERGPVYFLYEGHTEFDAPEPCTRVDRTTYAFILNSFWISDAEMATFLQETYPGMPVRYANFTHETRPGDAGFTELQWTWQHEGEERSRVTIFHDGDRDGDFDYHNRFFWWNGSSASYMNITEDFKDPGSDQLMRSDIRSPMLMADWPVQDPLPYAGLPTFNATVKGQIRVFEDLECEKEA